MAPGGVEPPRAASKAAALSTELRGLAPSMPGREREHSGAAKRSGAKGETRVAEGTRTPDHRDHNPGLYQLSYRHRGANSLARRRRRGRNYPRTRISAGRHIRATASVPRGIVL